MDLLVALQKDFIIGDGGYGATILSHGLAEGECEESWNLSHPEKIEQFHREFIEAGSEVIQTNTLKANRIFLSRLGMGDKVAEINQAGATIARQARSDKPVVVVASIGPIGELLEPYGPLTAQQAAEVFAEQAQALAEGGVEGFFIETFTSLEEAEIAVGAAKQTGLPVACSFAFQPSGATVMGAKPGQIVERIAAAGAEIIGANCGVGPAQLFPIMEQFKKVYAGLTIAQPNAGMPQLIEGKTVFPAIPAEMADYALRFRDLGVNIIGGCCGTKPEHIRAMTKALRGN